MAILEMKNVYFSYNKKNGDVISNLCVSFEQGSLSAIVGESGSGKSTILMLLSAMEKKYQGEILYNNINIKSINQNSYRAKNVGIIFQNYNLLHRASAIDNVLMALYISTNKTPQIEKAHELLLRVGIPLKKHNDRCVNLSGGEQQRVAIARAISGEPSILIADEPTGSLDSKTANEILNILEELNNNGVTIIIVTHDINVANRCKRVIEIADGHLL